MPLSEADYLGVCLEAATGELYEALARLQALSPAQALAHRPEISGALRAAQELESAFQRHYGAYLQESGSGA